MEWLPLGRGRERQPGMDADVTVLGSCSWGRGKEHHRCTTSGQ